MNPARKKTNSSIGIAPPKAGIPQSSVADLFGKTKNALPNSRSRRKPSGVSTAMVRQNAFLGNRKSGRQPNHQPSAPIGMMNNSRLQVYPSGVGLSGRGLQNDGVNNRPQRERSWND